MRLEDREGLPDNLSLLSVVSSASYKGALKVEFSPQIHLPESRVTSLPFPSVPPHLVFSCPGLLVSGFCLFVFGHTIRLSGSLFPDQRSNPPLISESAESYPLDLKGIPWEFLDLN